MTPSTTQEEIGMPDEAARTREEVERCGGKGQIWTHRDDGRGSEFNMHPDSTAGSSIYQCPGCPDCEPDPTPATCPECGLDHPIGTPHPSLADTESEERQVEPRKPGAFRLGWCIECGAIKPDTDTREFPITVLNCHPDRIEWFVPASQLDSAITERDEARAQVQELAEFIEAAEGGYGK